MADLSFASSADFEHVYEPAEDTWLLQDALSAEVRSGALCGRRAPAVGADGQSSTDSSVAPAADVVVTSADAALVCVEIGCGSGAVITHLGALLGAQHAYYGTDINPRAIELARRTAVHNRVAVQFVETSFVDALLPALEGRIDVLLFNPPYVPTPRDELLGTGIERSWAGGARGREVLDLLLPSVARLLSARGVFYLITVDDNAPDEIAALLGAQGLHSSVVLRKKAHNEKLQVMKFVSNCT